MELARILLKLLYLTVLYIIIYLVVKPQVQLDGMNLNIVVLGFSVLFLYFTFDYVYNFLMTSEIVLQNKNNSNLDKTKTSLLSDIKVPENGSHTTVENKVRVDNKASSEYLMDHTHKFVQNKIFD